MNSGFLSDTDVIAEMTSTFADAEVISRGSSFFIARASRYDTASLSVSERGH